MFNIRVLSQDDTETVLDMRTVIEEIEKVYVMKSKHTGVLFPMVFHEFEPGKADMDIKSGLLKDAGIFGLKLVSWFGANKEKGLPMLTGTVMVFDLHTGQPVGLLSAEHLTGMRTGAAGAIGTKYLANSDAETLLIVGAGHQSVYQIAAHLTAMDHIKKVLIHDRMNPANAKHLASGMPQILKNKFLPRCATNRDGYLQAEQKFNVNFEAADHLERAVNDSQIIVTVTPSREAMVMKSWVRPGTHFSCMGSDMSGKQEISEKLFEGARVFTDDISQAINVGEVEKPIKLGIIAKDDILGEIGDVIANSQKGRVSKNDITIFDSTGIALQDLMVAGLALKIAGEKNIGTVVAL